MESKRQNMRVPVALQVLLRTRKVANFISKYATNISSSGLFISTRTPEPEGAEIRFEVTLSDGTTAISGLGRVVWTRPFDPTAPKAPHGMGLEFLDLSPGSTEVIQSIVAHRRAQGLDDTLELPEIIENPLVPVAVADTGFGLATLEELRVDMDAVMARARALVNNNVEDDLMSLLQPRPRQVALSVAEASDAIASMVGVHTPPPYRRSEDPATPDFEGSLLMEAGNLAEQGDFAVETSTPEPVTEELPELGLDEILLEEESVAHESLPSPEQSSGRLDTKSEPWMTSVRTQAASRTEPNQELEMLEDVQGEEPRTQLSDLGPLLESLAEGTGAPHRTISRRQASTPPPIPGSSPPVSEATTELGDVDLIELDMLEDDELSVEEDLVVEHEVPVEEYSGESATSVPPGINVQALDAMGLEDHGIYDLSRPGGSPIDLASLADLPADDEDDDEDLDLPDNPRR